MDIQKPIRMLEGIGKMYPANEYLQLRVNEMKTLIYMEWSKFNEQQQNKCYTLVCTMFASFAARCIDEVGEA